MFSLFVLSRASLGGDGDFLYRGLGYKTLLDVISRGLQNLPARPCLPHRLYCSALRVVFAAFRAARLLLPFAASRC
jgi:hypothetical protein